MWHRETRASALLKRYIYISDAKLERFNEVIPKSPFRLSDFTIDLKLFKISLKSEPPEETRTSKLYRATKYVRSRFDVGSIRFPDKPYISDSIPMEWGIVTLPVLRPSGGCCDMAYFQAYTDQYTVLLGGSPKHLINYEPSHGKLSVSTYSMNFLRALEQLASNSEVDDLLKGQLEWEEEGEVRTGVGAIGITKNSPQQWTQEIEFLAEIIKVIPQENYITKENRIIIFGTPIYAALPSIQTPSSTTVVAMVSCASVRS